MSLMNEIVNDSLPIWQQCLESRFVQGLADGTLDKAAFKGYIVEDTLYLKADAGSVESFQRAGGSPFRVIYKDGRTETMNYWTVPEEAMENPPAMQPWGRLALAAAVRGRKPKKAPVRR